MMLLKIALRNILRNLRRSTMTASAIAVGAIALILFGEYIAFIMIELKTGAVANGGHFTVYEQGYFDFGSGNPAGYSIGKYRDVIRLIENDPALKPKLNVVTPTVSLFGIAGNFAVDSSKTFFGTGFVAADRDKMRRWNEYNALRFPFDDLGVSDGDLTHGVIGIGLARVLGLCKPLKVADCPEPPRKAAAAAQEGRLDANIAELAEGERADAPAAKRDGAPRIDLLGATADGAPNVVSFYVNKTTNMGYKELDDAYVGMNIELAQQLLYGRGEHKAGAIQIQLHRTEDMAFVRQRLTELFAQHRLSLEIHDYEELSPQYRQIVGFMGAIFLFIAVIMAVIVLFTIVNTMSMSVMERVNEIGTMRAMGVRRSGIRRQFLAEGWMLGAIGATLGVAVASIVALWFNHAGVTYMPPGQAHPVPLLLQTDGVGILLFGVWFGLVLMAMLASFVPAGRAAKMQVVDALRHV
jgi:putative ABC transport system permease protein